jgi:WD40 repeat protein
VDVWDASTGDRVSTLVTPVAITTLGFSADGATIATGHADGTVRLWDAASGIQELSLGATSGQVTSLAFSPDGRMLATNGGDGIVRIWALDVDDLVAIAEQRLSRGFTDDECRQYLHVRRCPTR